MVYYVDNGKNYPMKEFNYAKGSNTIGFTFSREILKNETLYREFCRNAVGEQGYRELSQWLIPELTIEKKQAEDVLLTLWNELETFGWGNELDDIAILKEKAKEEAEQIIPDGGFCGCLWVRMTVISWFCQDGIQNALWEYGNGNFLLTGSDGLRRENPGDGIWVPVQNEETFLLEWPWDGNGRLVLKKFRNDSEQTVKIWILDGSRKWEIRIPEKCHLNVICNEKGAITGIRGMISFDSPFYQIYRRKEEVIRVRYMEEHRAEIPAGVTDAVSDGTGGIHYLDGISHFSAAFCEMNPRWTQIAESYQDVLQIYAGHGTVALLRENGEVFANVRAFYQKRASAVVEVPEEGVYLITADGTVIADDACRTPYNAEDLKMIMLERFSVKGKKLPENLREEQVIEAVNFGEQSFFLTEDLELIRGGDTE